MSTTVTPGTSVPAALLPLFAIIFCGFLTVGLPLSVLPTYVHEGLGFGTVTVGWAVGVQSLATVLTRRVGGEVADGRGPKRAVLLGLPIAVLAGLAYLASAAIAEPRASLAVLMAGRLALGAAESLFLTGTMAWGIARLGPARTGVVMAWQGLAMYLALSAGAPLGLYLMQRGGFVAVAAAATLVPLAALAVALALPAVGPLPRRGDPTPFLRVVRLIPLQGTALAFGAAGFAAITTFAPLFFSARGWPGAGLAVTGFGIGFIVVRLFLANLADRYGGRMVGGVSLAVESVGQFVLWAAPDPATAIAGATLSGIGFSLIFPAMGVEALRRVPAESRGMAIGAFVAFMDVALGLTGPLLGLLVAASDYPAAFLAGGFGCLAAVLLLVAAPGRER